MSEANAQPNESKRAEDDSAHGPQGVLQDAEPVVAFLGGHPVYIFVCPHCGEVSVAGRFPTVLDPIQVHTQECLYASRNQAVL
jgi:hypothetical protein